MTAPTAIPRTPPSYRWHVAALVLAAIHHLDHALRGTHIGWPLTAEVNTFTYTLAIYPLIALGFVLRSVRYWLTVAVGGVVLLAAVHTAIEQPAEILGGYAQPVWGLVAFADLVALIVVLTVIAFRYAMLLRSPRPRG
ncbi:MAG: hypothetical protein ACRDGT_05485 [Candidatus Limnocylindria bacterium]